MSYLLGEVVPLTADLTDNALVPEDAASLTWLVRDPLGVQNDLSGYVEHPSVGVYVLPVTADTVGRWYWRLITTGNVAVAEGNFDVESQFAVIANIDAPTDLRVLVPRARRYCEGPYGAPEGKPSLAEQQLYEMCADGLSEIILLTGSQFGHTLNVTKRDLTAGFPVAWATDVVLDEWESSLIVSQVALNYYFHLFRDMKTSMSIANEGTTYEYTLSANVLRDYLKQLQIARDMGIEGLRRHRPVLDRFASNIRVRDQATVALLEWWDTVSPGWGGGGLPGGQEAAVIPWTPGWTGP